MKTSTLQRTSHLFGFLAAIAAGSLVSSASLVAGTAPAKSSTSGKGAMTIASDTVSPWEVTAASGLSLTKGNSDTLGLTVQILASYLTSTDEVYLGADYAFGQNKGSTVTNNFHGSAQYNRLLTDRFYLGVVADVLHDVPANLDYRISAMPTLGYYLIKNDTTKLAIETGAGYIWQNQGGHDNYFALRFAERFSYQISAGSKIWESISYLPKTSDFNNYLLVAEIGIETRLSDHWALRTWARDTYDSTPAAGHKANDLSVLAGLSYSLGGFPEPAPAAGRRSLKAAKAAPAPTAKGWHNTASLGFGLTKGNSDTLLTSLGYDLGFVGDSSDFSWNILGAYGKTDGKENVKFIRTAAQNNWLLDDRFYAGLRTSFAYDHIAKLDYRFAPNALIGYYLLKSDKVMLSVDAGPGYLWEKLGGVKDDYGSVSIGEKLTYAVATGVNVGESVNYLAKMSDWGRSILSASAFLEADITANLAWRISATYQHDNAPAIGSKKDDLILSAGIAVKF